MPSCQEFGWEMTKYMWEYDFIYLIYFLKVYFTENMNQGSTDFWFYLRVYLFYFVLFHAGVFVSLVWEEGLVFLLYFFECLPFCRGENYNTLQHSCYLSHMAKGSAFQIGNTWNGTIFHKEIIFQSATQKWQDLWKCPVEGMTSWPTQKTSLCSDRSRDNQTFWALFQTLTLHGQASYLYRLSKWQPLPWW